jgi:hypothetical protein
MLASGWEVARMPKIIVYAVEGRGDLLKAP